MARTACRFAATTFCSLALLASLAMAGESEVEFDRESVQQAARGLAAGGELRLSGFPLATGGLVQRRALLLERFEAFAPRSRIVLHTATGDRILPRPANVYLRGRIDGEPGSRVVLSVLDTGEVRGLATAKGRTWLIGSGAAAADLGARELDGPFELEEAGGGFRCALDDLGPEAFRAGGPDESREELVPLAGAIPDALAHLFAAAPGSGVRVPEGGIFDHTAVIAIETDNEYLAKFAGNTVDATNYIADLIAYASSIYTSELQTSWAVGDVSLWVAADPWGTSDPGCGLLEFGRYWNLTQGASVRTLAHFLSGKSTNAGIAWLGVLCRSGFSANPASFGGCPAPVNVAGNWGGGYGFTSGIDGNFDIDNPALVWDIIALTHEIGHNFNSPHTHCYQNLGGNAAAVDPCYGSEGNAGCYAGGTSLPSGCPGAGQGCGTIMSYCHLRSPGTSNLSLTLGLGHPYGVQPQRVPSRMRSHVLSVAASNPSCLAPINAPVGIFANGFQSGNTIAWSATSP